MKSLIKDEQWAIILDRLRKINGIHTSNEARLRHFIDMRYCTSKMQGASGVICLKCWGIGAVYMHVLNAGARCKFGKNCFMT